jgi:hypothetical protein
MAYMRCAGCHERDIGLVPVRLSNRKRVGTDTRRVHLEGGYTEARTA